MAALPAFVPPQLATLVDRPPVGADWLHEQKFDGYRLQIRIAAGKVQALTRNGLDWSAKFAAIVRAAKALRVDGTIIDGEACVFTDKGVSSFGGLKDALSTGGDRIVLQAFDLLFHRGEDLRGRPLEERKARLRKLLEGARRSDRLLYSDHVADDGAKFFKAACRLGLEGIVSKRATAPYRSGRGDAWRKTKCVQRQEFVVGGWQESKLQSHGLKSLLLGTYDKAGALIFAGAVGTGFHARNVPELRKGLTPRPTAPFKTIPREYIRGSLWAEPTVVVEIQFTEWTSDGILRHPSFKGLREDKPPRQVRREAQ